MGKLVDGIWRDSWYDTSATGGAFKRDSARFRNWITPDGAPGPSGEGGFAAQSALSRAFRSRFGEAPSALRRRNGAR